MAAEGSPTPLPIGWCERRAPPPRTHGAGRGVSLFEQLIGVAGRRMALGRPSTTATRQYSTNCYSVPRATVVSPHTTAARSVSLPSSVSRLTAAVRFGSLLSCCTKPARAQRFLHTSRQCVTGDFILFLRCRVLRAIFAFVDRTCSLLVVSRSIVGVEKNI